MKSPLRHLNLTGCLLFLLIVGLPSVALAHPVRPSEPLLPAFTHSQDPGYVTQAPPPGPSALTATRVYGQNGDFSSGSSNKGGISAKSLSNPLSVTLDKSSGDLYVADYSNSRVLYFPAGSTTATRVYGQAGSFSSGSSNKGGISAKSLSFPEGVRLDRWGNLYIADTGNSRVLYFPAGSTTATRVYGQDDFSSGSSDKGGSSSATGLSYPSGITLDRSGDLYVTDTGNSRVLYFPAGSSTATRVYGQAGSFSTTTINKGGISANSLNHPLGATLDRWGNLYVADYDNNRVLYFPAGSTTATRVYGQAGSFSTNKSGISANSFTHILGLALDSRGDLYTAGAGEHRVLYFPAGSTTATRVYGQAGSFSTKINNKGGISAKSLSIPEGLALDSRDNLYVADTINNRVLMFPHT